VTERGRPPAEQIGPAEHAALLCLAATAVIGAPLWLATGLAALAHTGRWLSLPPAALGAALARWPAHPSDPALAFPPPARAFLPAPVLLYALVLLVYAAAALAGFGGCRLAVRLRGAPAGYAPAAEIRANLSVGAVRARARQTRPSLGRRPDPRQVGLSLGTDARWGQPLWGSVEDSYLYLGPPRSGKGVHLIIGQTLDAPGPVLVTATRPDTLAATLTRRARCGPVAVFDPQNLAGPVPRLRWAPEHGCADPLTAIARARALAAGAQPAAGGLTDAAFWQAMTEAVLRCYLHAAALTGASMREVLAWAARPADPTPIRILRKTGGAAPGWAEELAAQAGADPRQRDSVWSGVRRATDALADPRVLAACCPPAGEHFDPAAFLRQSGTLYLLGSTGTQLSLAPLITALVEQLTDTARQLAARSPGGRLDPPLLLLLDEAANIAPLPSLPSLLADGGGSGITTVAVLQSLAQAGPAGGRPAPTPSGTPPPPKSSSAASRTPTTSPGSAGSPATSTAPPAPAPAARTAPAPRPPPAACPRCRWNGSAACHPAGPSCSPGTPHPAKPGSPPGGSAPTPNTSAPPPSAAGHERRPGRLGRATAAAPPAGRLPTRTRRPPRNPSRLAAAGRLHRPRRATTRP